MSVIVADTLRSRVAGAAVTTTKGLNVGGATTVAGAVVATSFVGTVTGSTGTFSGAVNIDDTTQSTSITTGALIVDGGVGIAKTLTVGGNISVGGTLTYEDVTNIDSVGLITARSGIQFGVAGVGGTIRANGDTTLVGVVTASEFVGGGSGLTGLNIPAGFTELDAMLFN